MTRTQIEIISILIRTRPALIRNAFGYTQEYVSECLQIGQTTYSRWDNGLMPFRLENVDKLAAVYGLSFEEFFGDLNIIEKRGQEARKLC